MNPDHGLKYMVIGNSNLMICILNHPRLFVSKQMENFISIQRVNGYLMIVVVDIRQQESTGGEQSTEKK